MIFQLTANYALPPWTTICKDPGKGGCLTSCVVRAPTEQRAREIASLHACDEGRDAWLDPDAVRVTAWDAEGEDAFILGDEEDSMDGY